MADFMRELMFGKRPMRRTDPETGQSEWYYLDPRGTDSVEDMKQIDVPNQNTPNPFAKQIQRYLYKNDEYNYKLLYGDTPPPLNDSNSYTTESAWGYPNNSTSPFYQNLGRPYDLKPWHSNEDSQYLVGSLSQEFESNGNPAAIGFDDSGGYSYGLYQIATRPGTMQEYLQYLANSSNQSYQNYATILNNAGGNIGALNKTTDFANAWTQLAQYPQFASSQSDFIGKNRYDKIISKIQDIQGLDLSKRHPVVNDAIRSMAVQHGQAQIPIHNALGTNSDISSWSDEDIINALYDARSDYVAGIHYTNPSDIRKQQNIITKRYPKERQRAIDLLKKRY